ncbi:DUF2264 domain-containing protein [Umezawaea sp.]|uniref:DUF2264 domain-containing protein n=1 Tax=Umezawaea sp. TaxID=1955258 RepID=UPI002ED2C7F2
MWTDSAHRRGFPDSVGRGDAETARAGTRALELLETWYRGEGWYTDGDDRAFDHCNGWALHLHPVLDNHLAGTRHDDRLRAHLAGFSPCSTVTAHRSTSAGRPPRPPRGPPPARTGRASRSTGPSAPSRSSAGSATRAASDLRHLVFQQKAHPRGYRMWRFAVSTLGMPGLPLKEAAAYGCGGLEVGAHPDEQVHIGLPSREVGRARARARRGVPRGVREVPRARTGRPRARRPAVVRGAAAGGDARLPPPRARPPRRSCGRSAHRSWSPCCGTRRTRGGAASRPRGRGRCWGSTWATPG